MTDELITKFENATFIIISFGFLLLLSVLEEKDMLWGIIGLMVGALVGYTTCGLLSKTDDCEEDWEDGHDESK